MARKVKPVTSRNNWCNTLANDRAVVVSPLIMAAPVRLRRTCCHATRTITPSFLPTSGQIMLSILAAGGRTITVADVTRGCDLDRVGEGGLVDQQLKQLMKELGEAINGSLSDSEQIAEVVARIKEGGYDIFLVLEATIGVSKQGENTSDKTSLVSTLSTNPEFKISDQDLKFLKSLRIKIDEEEE